jgi:hypothetical protein
MESKKQNNWSTWWNIKTEDKQRKQFFFFTDHKWDNKIIHNTILLGILNNNICVNIMYNKIKNIIQRNVNIMNLLIYYNKWYILQNVLKD